MSHAPFFYNPALLTPDALIELFVARTHEFEELVRVLQRTSTRPTHHVIVGQRGSGKSTLLHRIAAEVERDSALRAAWTPLTFSEEQYNVREFTDLLSNIADALVERVEARGDKPLASALQREIDAFSGSERAQQLVRWLEAYAKRTQTRLLLLIDNLDDVLRRLKSEDEWKLRALLNEHKWLAIIGASPNMLESAYTYGAAFYEFFRVHELGGLDDEQTLELFDRLAEAQNAAHVRTIVRDDPARIAAVRRLAGGNLRALIQLFEVLSRNTVGTVEDDLHRLLDLCSPLYKARVDSLSDEQQAVFTTVALGWYTMTAREVCDAMRRTDINAVSSQLDRLCKQGLIERVNIGESRDGFRVVERLFNIWFLMRFSRRSRQKVLWLVEFLRDFYSTPQLREFGMTLLQKGDGSERHARVMLATATALSESPVKEALERHALEAIINTSRELSELLGPNIDTADRDLADRATNIATMQEVKRAIFALKELPEGVTHELVWNQIGGAPDRTPRQKLEFVRELDVNALAAFAAPRSKRAATTNRTTDTLHQAHEHFRQSIQRGLIASHSDFEGIRAESAASGLPLEADAVIFLVLGCTDEATFAAICKFVESVDTEITRRAWAVTVVHDQRWLDQLLEHPALSRDAHSIFGGENGAITTQYFLLHMLVRQGDLQRATQYASRLLAHRPSTSLHDQALCAVTFTAPFAKHGHPDVALQLLRDAQLDGQFAPITAVLEALLPGGDPTFARLPPEIASTARDILAVFAQENAHTPPTKAPRAGSKSKRTSPRSRRG